jgi:type IV secretion system protein VirD4
MLLQKNATDGKRDFWTESALNFLSAIILYVKEEYKNKANMTHVIDFAVRAGREEDYLDEIIDGLNEEHPAYNLFKLASISAGNTKSGIMATMAQQIGIFALRKVARLTETSDFLFEDLQREKGIVYVKIPMDETHLYN